MNTNITDQIKEVKDEMVEVLGLSDIKTEIETEMFLNSTVERFWIPLDELEVWLMHYPSTHYRKSDAFLPSKMIYPDKELIQVDKVNRQLRNTPSSRIEYLEKEIRHTAAGV